MASEKKYDSHKIDAISDALQYLSAFPPFWFFFLFSLQVFPQILCVRGLWMPRAASWWQQVGSTTWPAALRNAAFRNQAHSKDGLKACRACNCQSAFFFFCLHRLLRCIPVPHALFSTCVYSDGVCRGEKLINLKQIADEALEKCKEK